MFRSYLRTMILLGVLVGFSSCSSKTGGNLVNPFYEPPDKNAEFGEKSLKPLMDEGESGTTADEARHSLEVMASYRRQQEQQPYYPVVQPAEVRLMWVPDHINKNGDLVPAHYYYLRVLNDRWAVQDAFELEEQLSEGSKGHGGATPWVFGEPARR
jgi:hypothetical protein